MYVKFFFVTLALVIGAYQVAWKFLYVAMYVRKISNLFAVNINTLKQNSCASRIKHVKSLSMPLILTKYISVSMNIRFFNKTINIWIARWSISVKVISIVHTVIDKNFIREGWTVFTWIFRPLLLHYFCPTTILDK